MSTALVAGDDVLLWWSTTCEVECRPRSWLVFDELLLLALVLGLAAWAAASTDTWCCSSIQRLRLWTVPVTCSYGLGGCSTCGRAAAALRAWAASAFAFWGLLDLRPSSGSPGQATDVCRSQLATL